MVDMEARFRRGFAFGLFASAVLWFVLFVALAASGFI
jgi:hypothetical protein